MRPTDRRTRPWRLLTLALGASLALAAGNVLDARPAAAQMAAPESMPIERVLKNLAAYVKEHPDDAGGYARLARVNEVVFLNNTDAVAEYNDGYFPGYRPGDKPTAFSNEALQVYGRAAALNFARAIELDPKNAQYQLNVGFFLDQGAKVADFLPFSLPAEKPTAAQEQTWRASIRQLGSAVASERDAAQAQLQAAGATAIPLLKEFHDDPDLQIRDSVRSLIDNCWSGLPLPAPTAAQEKTYRAQLFHFHVKGDDNHLMYKAAQESLAAAGVDALAVLLEHRDDDDPTVAAAVRAVLAQNRTRYWRECALSYEWRCYTLTLDQERKDIESDTTTSGLNREAAETYLTLAQSLDMHTDEVKQNRATILTNDWQNYSRSFEVELKLAKVGKATGQTFQLAGAYQRAVRITGTKGDEVDQHLATIKDNVDKMNAARTEYQKQQYQKNGFVLATPATSSSPIIFSLTAAQPLHALVAPAKSVHFDLVGDGCVRCWTWVKPDTAILCWDPNGTGKIASGVQLFGNATWMWWIFWDNGYQALDALDDNRDGVLTGAELTGLCVWRDANQNGIADPGEVVPVVNLGIDSIAVRAPQTEDGCPANKLGIHFEDGRTLPTYD
ncbi:MAG: hypothetical protein ACREJ2_02470, partial [Planctomycetota bacterium]